MNVGIPKEIKAQENRVSMVPGSVAELVKRGHRVIVQSGAGEGASYCDDHILEVDFERMRFLDITMCGTSTVYSNEANLAELLPRADLVIGAVLVPGAKAPKLITREMLGMMPRGSVFVDIAVDQGGCSETTRATTHDNPTFEEEGVLHYCVANMPGAYSRTATQALNNVTHPWTLLIAEHEVRAACRIRPELAGGINVCGGKITCAPVAAAHGLPCRDALSCLAE
jgi:alanine dehydrogenase